MTVAVPLDTLQTTIEAHYKHSVPYIITSDGTAPPRITHVRIHFISPVQIKTRLGATALRTINQSPHVSILYAHESLSLIIDGIVNDIDQGEVTIQVQSAIRHQSRS